MSFDCNETVIIKTMHGTLIIISIAGGSEAIWP